MYLFWLVFTFAYVVFHPKCKAALAGAIMIAVCCQLLLYRLSCYSPLLRSKVMPIDAY